jgi:hypothetical protein
LFGEPGIPGLKKERGDDISLLTPEKIPLVMNRGHMLVRKLYGCRNTSYQRINR